LREELKLKEAGSMPVSEMGSIESRRPVVRDENKEMYFQEFRKKADEEAKRKSTQPSQIIDQTSRLEEKEANSVQYRKPLCKLMLTYMNFLICILDFSKSKINSIARILNVIPISNY